MIIECASCKTSNRLPATRLTDKAKCAACKSPLLPLEHPIPVGSVEDFDELVRDAPAPVLVDFWPGGVGRATRSHPSWQDRRRAVGKVIVAKVDTEALQQVATRFGIRSIPTMILFKGGKEAKRVSGAIARQRDHAAARAVIPACSASRRDAARRFARSPSRRLGARSWIATSRPSTIRIPPPDTRPLEHSAQSGKQPRGWQLRP